MKLTPEEQKAIARKATWYFDCYFGLTRDDSSVFTGDGVDDLDRLISRLDGAIRNRGVGVNARFQVDVETQYSSWKNFDLEDLRAIRNYFVQIYGEVPKPTVLERTDLVSGQTAVQL